MIVDRGPPLPAGAISYRRIGPFDADAIPTGLLRRHDLKPGVWGVLTIAAGRIRFCWDDDAGGSHLLAPHVPDLPSRRLPLEAFEPPPAPLPDDLFPLPLQPAR